MNERNEFVRRVLENPADDTVRLVFADWLQENGEPERAALIRLSLHAGVKPPAQHIPGCLRRGYWKRPLHRPATATCRKCSAQDAYRLRYSGMSDLQLDALPGGCRWRTDRGFVSEIHLPCAAFMRHARAIFSAHPVTRVVLTDKRPDWDVHTMPSWTWWQSGGDGSRPDDEYALPVELFDRLKASACVDWGDLRKSFLESEQEAFDALSESCVAYARELVGLPALTPVEVR